MPEKDEFTFDDDNFPETDLSEAFADAEAEVPPRTDDEPEILEDLAETDEYVAESSPSHNPKGEGGSTRRTLLLVLLLIVIAAGGAYYFMSLGGMTTDSAVSQQNSRQVVAVPTPQPAETPATVPAEPPSPQPAVAEIADNKEVTVIPVLGETVAEGTEKADQTRDSETGADVTSAPEKPVAESLAAKAAGENEADAVTQKQPEKVETGPTSEPAVVPTAPATPYVLDAGAFLFAAQSDDLKRKISALGYQPVVSEVKASVRLIRLRVGSYAKEQLPAALDDARKIAPDAFSLAKDGQYVVYAGSFADQENIKRLRERFRAVGVTVEEEPVKVEKNLSRIRFGEFKDDVSAAAAADKAEEAGIPVRVVEQ